VGGLYIVISAAFTFLIVSCGGSESLTSIVPDSTSQGTDRFHSAAVMWGNAIGVQPEIRLQGDMEHIVNPDRFDKTPLMFTGIVKTQSIPRDITLVVDVSGSTGGSEGSDPIQQGTCSRLEAAKALVAAAKEQGEIRFAVVTFSGVVNRTSNGFFSSLEAMFSGESLVDIFCQSKGGTNYSNALDRAKALILGVSDRNSVKELYFITDGSPQYWNSFMIRSEDCNFRASCSGINQAVTLKEDLGVMLVTLMLGNNVTGSEYLKNYIAGLSPNQSLLHGDARDASQLSDVLLSLSLDQFLVGFVSYRHLGATDWVQMEIWLCQFNCVKFGKLGRT
jgi:hypothetical protein